MSVGGWVSCCKSIALLLLAGVFALPVFADSGTVTQIYSFSGGISGPDAANPSSGVILGRDGNYYGTTAYGGLGSGAVFKLTPAGVETVLLAFDGTHGSSPDEVMQASDGNLYGTTYWGGPNNGYGTVYKLTTSGVQTVLYNFTSGDAAGTNPNANLVEGSDGNFYGTASGGGASFGGTLFRITGSGTLTVLHSFGGSDGSGPHELTLGRDGKLYGITVGGGTGGYGTVFKVNLDGSNFSVLHSFSGNPDAAIPNGPLLEASDGSFYGISEGGGSGSCGSFIAANCGTVYKVTPDGQETVVHSFSGSPNDGEASCSICAFSSQGLVQGSDGNIYGVTLAGGSYMGGNCSSGCGTLFQISPDGTETVLQSFIGPWDSPNDGWAPAGALIETSPGVFIGTTVEGTSGWGNVYKYTAPPSATPSVSIAAEPASIMLGQSSTLSWTSANVDSCTASGDWSGQEFISGSATVTPTAAGSLTYTLTCSGAGGLASVSAGVTVSAPPPTVTLSASPATVHRGQSVMLSWSSSLATSCIASGAWSGSEGIAGNLSLRPTIVGTSSYTLTCSGAGGTASASTSVSVEPWFSHPSP